MAPRRPAARASSSTRTKREPPSASTLPRRQSKRLRTNENIPSTARYTSKQSAYFTDDTEDRVQDESTSEAEYARAVSASSVSSPDLSEEDEFSEQEQRGGRTRTRRGKRSPVETPKASELWREGARTGLGPGKQVVVQLPKARQAGDRHYEDHTIHPNTLLFLNDLRQNNDREWLKAHDADFRTSEKDFDSFAALLTEKIIEKDNTIPELPVKDIKFRIYRDVRFSKDPTPYKSHFSAAWSRTGRKGPYAGYYLQVSAGNSFIGGGLWQPEAQPLAALRRDIDRNPHRVKRVLTQAPLRQAFFGGIPDNETRAVESFIAQNRNNMLKTKPKGFDPSHADIGLLRLRSFTIGKPLSDAEVLDPQALSRIADLIGCLTPFITYLNSVVMPDDDSDSDSDSGSGSDPEDGDEQDAEGDEGDG